MIRPQRRVANTDAALPDNFRVGAESYVTDKKITIPCSGCGKLRTINRRSKKKLGLYCHPCAQRRRKRKGRRPAKTVACIGCGVERTSTNRLGKRCKPCGLRASWVERKHPPVTCASCGKSFEWKSRRTPIKYCSMACRDKNKSITKRCPVCNKQFKVARSNADRYNVCSIACKKKLEVWADCERCGKRFRYSNLTPRRHCSEKCRRPPHSNTCLNCKESFHVTPSTIETRRFCSFRCYRTFTGETGIERDVRLFLESCGLKVVREFRAGRKRDVFDFYLKSHNLLIECDGDYWHSKPFVRERDARKELRARKLGYEVLRLSEALINSSGFEDYLARVLKIKKPETPQLTLFSRFTTVRQKGRRSKHSDTNFLPGSRHSER
jgi:very-short-patch-repair endonuclease